MSRPRSCSPAAHPCSAQIFLERAAVTEDVKGDGSQPEELVCGLLMRNLGDEEHEGTRVFASGELVLALWWRASGQQLQS